MTLLYRAYAIAARLALPVFVRGEAKKLARDGMEQRAAEKSGCATLPRPNAPVIWFHAASVGESLSILSLVARMGVALPGVEFLITSGTASSAGLLESRMPPRTRHQFAPLDSPAAVDRFLIHWKPVAAVFVESELWPNMVMRSDAAGVPLALINARLSEGSLAGWRKRARTAAMLLGRFRLILTQTDELAAALVGLGADAGQCRRGVNLKSLSAPLPVDDDLVAQTRTALGARPVWIAASTHPGEEEIVLEAHGRLLEVHPDLCLILAPRHPDRGDAAAELIAGRGWGVVRRSAGQEPEGPVYLADSMGELGSWYALSPVVFLGGSLLPIGGHNPFEVAQAGGAVLSGPKVSNFTETYAAMKAAGAVRCVGDAATLAGGVDHWLADGSALDKARGAARQFSAQQTGALEEVTNTLIAALDLSAHG